MSKRVRNLILLAVALVVVTGGVVAMFFLLPDNTAQTTPQQTTPTQTVIPEIVISDKQYIDDGTGNLIENTINGVTVTNENGSYTLSMRNSDGLLAVTEYHDLPRDADAIDAICDNLLYMVAAAKPAVDEDDSAYGFDMPTAVIEATYADDTKETFRFGAASKGTEGYYCRRDGDDTLYIISNDIASQFLTAGKDLIGKVLIAPPSAKADDEEGTAQLFKLELTGTCRDQAVQIITDTDASYPSLTYVSTYVITAPYLRAVDSDSFHTTAQTMVSLTAAGVERPYPTQEQLKSYGISADASYSVAKFTLSVVAASSADGGGTISTHYNDREHMIILGDKNEDGYYYAIIDGYPVVYLLSPDSVPWAENTYFDLTSKLLFIKDITTIDSVTITESGVETAFTLTHNPEASTRDDQLTVTTNGKTYNTADFRTLYQLLLSIHRIAEKDDNATASGEPVLKLAMTFNDGDDPMEIALYPMSSSRYLLVTQDGEEIAVSISDTNDFVKQYKNYLSGQAVVTPY